MANRAERRKQARNPNVRASRLHFLRHSPIKQMQPSASSNLEFNVTFSAKGLRDIGEHVMVEIFGAEKDSAASYINQAQAQENAFLSVQGGIERLLKFTSDSDYRMKLAQLSEQVHDFKVKAYAYADNPLSLQVQSYALNLPERLVAKLRHAPRLTYLASFPLARLFFSVLKRDPSEGRKHKEIKSAIETAIRRMNLGVQGQKPSSFVLNQDFEKNYYGWINGAIALSQRFMIADWFETIVNETRKVAEEGSPKAAYLFFSRLSDLYVPDNLEESKKRAVLVGNVGKMVKLINLRKSRLLRRLNPHVAYTEVYTDIGKTGLDDVLTAIDLEQRRTRFRQIGRPDGVRHASGHNGLLVHYLRASLDSFNEISALFDFANRLEETGASPKTAGELLLNVPIGQRKETFQLLHHKPGIIRLYEQLRDGVDARQYMTFISELSNVEVQPGETLYDAVSGLADAQKISAAGWMIKNARAYSYEDLATLVTIAKSPASDAGLWLFQRWRYDAVKKGVVGSITPTLTDTTILASALTNVPNDRLAALHNPSLEEITGLQLAGVHSGNSATVLPEPAQIEFPAPKTSLWINWSYRTEPLLAEAMVRMHEAVPPHLRYRVRQLADHFEDTPAGNGTLIQYAKQISGMSPRLISYLLRTNTFFEAYLKHPPDASLVERLEKGATGGNPYAELANTLLDAGPSRLRPLRIFHFSGRDRVIEEGVAYRIVIIASFDARKQSAIMSKLDDTGIEAVFVSTDSRGTPPDCEGVMLITGATLGRSPAHYSAVTSFYQKGHYPMRILDTGVNPDRVVDALKVFRDHLAEATSRSA